MEALKLKGNRSQYLIVKEIGQGGMGTIYQATDLEYERIVAVKKANMSRVTEKDTRDQVREQMQHQLEALEFVDHPNVPKIYDQFSDEDNEYLVMEFIEGFTLMEIQEKTQEQGQFLEESRMVGWALQVLDALNYLHRQPRPIIHRDIKPHNLILNSDGRVMLIDFGLMKQSDRRFTEETSSLIRAVGTEEYAPPEQYADSGVRTDVRTDIYSLGATLYHLLAGRLPPRAVDRVMPVSIVSDITKRPPSLCQLNPTVSARTEQIIFKALEVDPEQRYQSAVEMHNDFYPRGQIIQLPSFKGRETSVELLIATFQNEKNRAGEVLQELKQLKEEEVLLFEEAAAITKTKAGRVEVKDMGDVDAKRGAVFGAITGAVVGLLGGPVGAIAGAVAGAATGGVTASMAHYGVSDELIQEVKKGLHSGSSAIIAYVEPTWVNIAVDHLEKRGAIVIHETLPRDVIESFRKIDQDGEKRYL